MMYANLRRLTLGTSAIALCCLGGATALAQDTSPAPLTFTDEAGTTTTMTPREDGMGITVQDARGVTTQFEYNAAGQLQFEDAPERGLLSYGYDDLGRPERVTMEGGVTSRLRYDAQNRVKRQVWRDGEQDRIVTRYTYDSCENGEGKLCRVEHNDHVSRYGYTANGQLAFASVKLGDEDEVEKLRYKYLDDGRLDTMRYPSGLLVKYRYDDQGRVKSLVGKYETGDDRERFTIVNRIAYDAVGRIEGFTHGNGIRTRYAYDDSGRLERITRKKDGELVGRDVYAYDADGQIDSITRLDPAQSRDYGYDGQGRLVFEQHGDGTADGTTVVGYTYDAVGNRLARTVDGRTRDYNYAPDANQLDAIGNKDLSYDERGNLLEDRDGRRSFAYDVTNRMSAYYKNGELRAEYDYDAQGRRIRKRLHKADGDGTKSLRFLYDTDGRLVSETARRDDRSAVRARDLVWLGPIAVAQVDRRVRANGTTRRADVLSLHTDHLGAPRAATDEAGTVVWEWHGDAFGAKAGSTPAVNRDPDGDGKTTTVKLRFPGQYADRESGLWYNHNRDYDSKLGRYVQSDPIGLGDGPNRYAYVGGNPVRFVDPNGLERYCYQTSGGIASTSRTGDLGGGEWGAYGNRDRIVTQYCWNIPRPSGPPITPITIPVIPIAPTPPPPPPPDPADEVECTPKLTYIANVLKNTLADLRAASREGGGLVYLNGTTLGHTAVWAPEGSNTVDIFSPASRSQIPAGATVIGGWHTHWNPLSSGSIFSGQDYWIANRDHPNNPIGSPFAPFPNWSGFAMGQFGHQGRLFFMPSAGFSQTEYMYNSSTIMDYANNISHCATV